jgi:mono/diheme cytochrome c family protein
MESPPREQCPQPRFTEQAPEPLYSYKNPLAADINNLTAGKILFGKENGSGCAICHGIKGEGNGPLANQYDPRPRNFACAKTVNSIPDGQLFWIIRNGSPGTAMPDHPQFNDTEIWQLVLHLRTLANP